MGRRSILSCLAASLLATTSLVTGTSQAVAQTVSLAPGDAVVSGFSGIRPSANPLPPGANPLDHFFINLDGPSAQILALSGLGTLPNGQLVTPGTKLQIKARDVGQVFAIAMDDGMGSDVPNIYLGSTSAFGVFIVGPDADGNGEPDRMKVGGPGATFMPGQFGRAPDGNPGTIWRVDGKTGAITAFATLPGNSGPGVGDITFDKRSRTFYVSDLDMGQIHRFDAKGVLLDSYDHGLNGRPAKGLAPVADDGKVMDITNPAFDTQNPTTWGYTQAERMVYGMAVHNGRLYYAVVSGRQVFSVGLNDDGTFAGDPRWELDATALPGDGPITDMLFDKRGHLYLAQRGRQKGSYNYSEFAQPAQSTVIRYRLEQPNDLATPGVWVPDPEGYAIGMPNPHQASNGGIALGFAHDAQGNITSGTSDSMLWTTGGRLRPGVNGETAPPAENDVHGLQGNDVALVRPQNVPPQQSYFADYDGLFSDPEKAGHLGDVEIWQPERGFAQVQQGGYGIIPPGVPLPPYIPPVVDPGYKINLALTKRSGPKDCVDFGATWRCSYTIRVRNTSSEHTFAGEIRVRDHLQNLPAGASIQVPQHPAPWFCSWIAAPDTFACKRNAVLPPNTSVGLRVHVRIPKSYNPCFLTNTAEITQPVAGSWQNWNWSDDIDGATALIPAPHCKPVQKVTNLKISKVASPSNCIALGGDVYCRFAIRVWNAGPGLFSHKLQVQDDPQAGVTAAFAGPFNCVPNGGGHLCTHNSDPKSLAVLEPTHLWAVVKAPIEVARANNCRIRNRVRIVTPSGAGHPMNVNAADDSATAVAIVPPEICNPPRTNIKVEKQAVEACAVQGDNVVCRWSITVRNTTANAYKGEIVLDEMLPAEPVTASWNAPWQCQGTGGGGGGATCKHPMVEIPGMGSRTLLLSATFSKQVAKENNCQLTNRVKIAKAPAGSDMNTNGGDDQAQATASVPQNVCITPVPQECPPGYRPEGNTCVPKGGRIIPPVVVPPPPTVVGCPQGTVGRHPNCRRIIVDPPRECPQGTIGRYPNCRRIEPPKVCPQGTIGRYPNCRKVIVDPPRRCPQGTIGRYPNCRKVIVDPPRRCPQGTVGRYPNCRKVIVDPPRLCPKGTVGRYPNCRRIQPPKACPRGTIGRWPKCRRIGNGKQHGPTIIQRRNQPR